MKGFVELISEVTFQSCCTTATLTPIQYLTSFPIAAQMSLRNNGSPLAAASGCAALLPMPHGVRYHNPLRL